MYNCTYIGGYAMRFYEFYEDDTDAVFTYDEEGMADDVRALQKELEEQSKKNSVQARALLIREGIDELLLAFYIRAIISGRDSPSWRLLGRPLRRTRARTYSPGLRVPIEGGNKMNDFELKGKTIKDIYMKENQLGVEQITLELTNGVVHRFQLQPMGYIECIIGKHDPDYYWNNLLTDKEKETLERL
jgi:hypothetical protein